MSLKNKKEELSSLRILHIEDSSLGYRLPNFDVQAVLKLSKIYYPSIPFIYVSRAKSEEKIKRNNKDLSVGCEEMQAANEELMVTTESLIETNEDLEMKGEKLREIIHPDDFEGDRIGLESEMRIIDRHIRRVWEESEVNKGATFFFTLPKT